LWTEAHAELETALDGARLGEMRRDLDALAAARRRVPVGRSGAANAPEARSRKF
jgi:hypothetical protein